MPRLIRLEYVGFQPAGSRVRQGDTAVSRFRRALAATTTLAAVAAASALLTSAAGAAPARAATTATTAAAPAPAGGHTIEVTAHPDTQRPGGASTQNCPLPNSAPASHITPA